MNELALFAGAGGGILGTRLLGWRVVCAVEINSYCREVLLRRQEEGIIAPFPIWDDVRTFDGKPWRGKVDVITAGFPCQGYSVAGKQLGEHDERNLWPDTIRIIGEVKPQRVLLENVPNLLIFGYFGTILGDLAQSGYDARWKVISAAEVGAPHLRNRVWIVAYNDLQQSMELSWGITQCRNGINNGGQDVANSNKGGDAQSRLQQSDIFTESSEVAESKCGEVGSQGGRSTIRVEDKGRGGTTTRGTVLCSRSQIPQPTNTRQGSKDVAHANSTGRRESSGAKPVEQKQRPAECSSNEVADTTGIGLQQSWRARAGRSRLENGSWWTTEPELGRVAHGVANRLGIPRAFRLG